MNVPQPSPRVRTAIREVILVAVLFLAYKIGRLAADGHVSDALSNAQSIWNFERALHLPSEARVQDAIIHHLSFVRATNMYYAFVHFPATIAGLVWLYLRRPAHYTWTRRLLAWLTAAALVLHLLLPLAPPRMLLDIGIVDTGTVYGPSVYGSPDTDTLANQFAAMPSLHVGWALAVAIGLITATRSRWRWAWLAHPVITLFVVVATGNHYWLDAIVAGGLVTFILAVMPRPVVADRERQPAALRRSGPLPPPGQRAGS